MATMTVDRPPIRGRSQGYNGWLVILGILTLAVALLLQLTGVFSASQPGPAQQGALTSAQPAVSGDFLQGMRAFDTERVALNDRLKEFNESIVQFIPLADVTSSRREQVLSSMDSLLAEFADLGQRVSIIPAVGAEAQEIRSLYSTALFLESSALSDWRWHAISGSWENQSKMLSSFTMSSNGYSLVNERVNKAAAGSSVTAVGLP